MLLFRLLCVCAASRGREKRTSVSSSAGGMRFLCTGVEAIRQSSKGRGRCRKSIFRKGFLHSVHLREEKVSCIVLLLLLRLKYLSLPAQKRLFTLQLPPKESSPSLWPFFLSSYLRSPSSSTHPSPFIVNNKQLRRFGP